jgi:antirestriction protein ArdC
MSSETKADVYTRVTNKILADLEQGVRPWAKPWSGEHAAGRITRPLRGNGQPYRGVNILLLWASAIEQGFACPVWMTYKQAQELGANVRKGERGSLVVYANTFTKTEANEQTGEDEEKQIPFMKGYTVFNVEQIEGLPAHYTATPEPAPETTEQRDERLERFFRNTGATIRHGGNRAFFNITADFVQMPPFPAFVDAESYYATLGHEMTHWTRHPSRLDRDLGRKKWGDEGYAKEELVAELGAAFLCADLGITPEVRDDHAAYIGSWLEALKDDKRFIFSAAAHAQRALDWLHGCQADQIEEEGKREAA